METKIGIIGGSGFYDLASDLKERRLHFYPDMEKNISIRPTE